MNEAAPVGGPALPGDGAAVQKRVTVSRWTVQQRARIFGQNFKTETTTSLQKLFSRLFDQKFTLFAEQSSDWRASWQQHRLPVPVTHGAASFVPDPKTTFFDIAILTIK